MSTVKEEVISLADSCRELFPIIVVMNSLGNTIGWPIGVGGKYSLTRKIAIGIEISNTYTTSDYIDDASDKYYDNTEIANAYGPIAASLADRHLYNYDNTDATPYVSGTGRRGDPKYNDAFIFTVITVTYKLKRDNTGLPKF